MNDMRKITANLPAGLLASCQDYTGQGVTETLRQALEDMKRKRAYQALLALRGKVQFESDWRELRGKDDE